MNYFKKGFVIAVIILQTILTLYSICAIFVLSTISDDKIFEQTIENSSIDIYFYKDWDKIIEHELSGDANEKLNAIMLKTFGETFEKEWLKANLISVIKDVLDVVSSSDSKIGHVIELKDRKELYAKNLATRLSKYPQEELALWNINLENVIEDSKIITENRLKIPDTISLQELVGDEIISEISQTSSRIINILINSVYVSVTLSIFLFISAIALLKRKAASKHYGIATIAGACFSFAIALILQNIAQNYTGKIFTDQLSFVVPIQNYFFKILTFRFFLISFAFLIIGLLIILSSKIIQKEPKNQSTKFRRMKTDKNIIFILVLVLLVSCKTADNGQKFSPFNFKMEEDMENKDKIEIVSVNVTPHVFSGEIPSYNRKNPFRTPENPGALIKIFVYNKDKENEFSGQVLFNSKNGIELLDEAIVSWCSVPDTRIGGLLSKRIPPESMDVYTLNVIDGEFYKNGIDVEFIYPDSQGSVIKHVNIETSSLIAERIVFLSSDGNVKPDEMVVWLVNNSDDDVILNELKFYTAKPYYSIHWWDKNIISEVSKTGIVNMTMKPGETNYIIYKLGEIPYGESLVSLDFIVGNKSEKIMYQIKPFVSSFDINAGWAGRHLAGSELFAKTVAMMHFNTVHGDSLGYNNTSIGQKYPLKGFGVYGNTEEMNKPENIKHIHGVEFLGEPQMSNTSPQEIFNKMTIYRTAGYPTTLTLTHEPGYYKYVGLVDLPHFDAYRVIAPHADKWGEYAKYGNKNTSWGAPLETAGIYVRGLHEMSKPNPVAAWTQGVAGGWFNIWRITSPNPNPTEIRIQAYQKVANGSSSLYWFNISGVSAIRSRYALDEIRNINREFMTVEDLIISSVPYSWENIFMDIDFNVLAGPDYVLLFATDLTYKVSPVNEFIISSPRDGDFNFKIPEYFENPDSLLKITKDGVYKLKAEFTKEGVSFTDTIFITGMYVVYDSRQVDYYSILNEKYNTLIAKELSVGFDPIKGDEDFELLRNEINAIP